MAEIDESEFMLELYKESEKIVTDHKIVYKYNNLDTGNLILTNQTLGFKSPLNLNDPFECDVSLINFNGQREAYLIGLFKKYPKKFSDSQQIELLKGTNDVKKNLGPFMEAEIRNDISQRRLSCFSESNKSILMWSHYGDCHTGICIGFNLYNLYAEIHRSSVREKMIVKVNYSKKFDSVNYFKQPRKSIINLLRTKYVDWDYEKEIRVVLYDPKFTDEIHIIPITKDCINSIYLGLRISKENEEKIRDTIEKKYPGIPVKKMIRLENTFDLLPI